MSNWTIRASQLPNSIKKEIEFTEYCYHQPASVRLARASGGIRVHNGNPILVSTVIQELLAVGRVCMGESTQDRSSTD